MAESHSMRYNADRLESLQVRAYALLEIGEAASTHSLMEVWPDGKPRPTPLGPMSAKEQSIWEECLVAHGRNVSSAKLAAKHLLTVIKFDGDANKVPYPHKMFRAGFPMPTRSVLDLQAAAKATLINDRVFVLPGSFDATPDQSYFHEDEQEIAQKWSRGLAKSAEDLRDKIHADCRSLDMAPAPWPMFPSSLIADAEAFCEDKNQRGPYFQEGRYLRALMHGETTELDFKLDTWRLLPENVIAEDVCTDAQLRLLESRAKRGPVSKAALERRRASIHPAFFEEIRPTLEKEAALAEAQARWAKNHATAALERDRAAAYGAQFVAWPVENGRRWPQPARAWVQHGRWFGMWRRSRRAMQAQARKAAKAGKKARPDSADGEGSEASWEALSECSDSSWQAVSELGDACSLGTLSEAELAKKVELVRMLKSDCEEDLNAAIPALTAACEALECLDKRDVVELKKFKKPPQGVVLVSKALCVCFGIGPKPGSRTEFDYWGHAKKLMGDAAFLNRLLSYDKDNIPAGLMRQLALLLADPEFQPAQIAKASTAAKGICQWVHALGVYAKVAHSIAPKREALKRAEAEVLQASRSQQAELAACGTFESVVEADTSDTNPEEVQQRKEQKAKALNEALQSMEELDSKDISELKSLGRPPVECAEVCAAVSLLLSGEKNCHWKDSQKMMSNPRAFVDTLKAFDAKGISDATLKRCEDMISQPFFNYEALMTKSKAAASLGLWALNVVAFRQAWGETDLAMESEHQDRQALMPKQEKSPPSCNAASSLKKGDIVELKCLANPPHIVKTTLEAVAILFEKEATWKGAKAMLNDMNFLSDILAFKASCVKPATLEQLERIVVAPEFLPSTVKKASAAAAGLCEWVHQIYNECSQDSTDTASTMSPSSTRSLGSSCKEDLSDVVLVPSRSCDYVVPIAFDGEAE